jgi:hypothetical protein
MAVSRVSNATAATAVAGLHMVTPTSVVVGSGTGSVAGQGAVTFSGASSVSLNGCFTTNYDNYRIIVTPTAVTGTNNHLAFRLRSNGTDNSGSNYYFGALFATATGTSGVNSGNGSNYGIIGFLSTGAIDFSNAIIDLAKPALTTRSTYHFSCYCDNGTVNFSNQGSGMHYVQSAYDGITVFVNTQTVAGTIRVYGYNNGGA